MHTYPTETNTYTVHIYCNTYIYISIYVRHFTVRCFLPHLFLISTVEVSPLLNWLSQVQGVHGYFDLSDHIVFGESIEVVDGHHQSLPAHLLKWDLEDSNQTQGMNFTHISNEKLENGCKHNNI